MRSWIALPLLCGACAVLQLVTAQCNIDDAKSQEVPFPNIENLAIESYQMSVEYNVPGAKQTDYYTEYYDMVFRRGKVEMHAAGKTSQYMYKTYSWEAWEIAGQTCKLQNITDTPTMFKEDQNEWLYLPKDAPERRTIGPSAMFKIAADVWNATRKDSKKTMVYMGQAEGLVRGIKSHYWRRCDTSTSYVDYFFAIDQDEEDPFGPGKNKKIPLRVTFGGKRAGRDENLEKQEFEIMSFQPFISLNEAPFQLPKRIGCKRGYLENPLKVPDFSSSNLQFQAEVIYRKVDLNGDDIKYWSYYSTLAMAVDVKNQHLAYFFTPWAATVEATAEPTVENPIYEVYDMKNHYLYKYDVGTGKCELQRSKTFIPKYKLPENGGSISLTSPHILYPNGEFSYLGEGTNRGLKVNMFEEIVDGYIIDKNNEADLIPKAIITRSYLKDDEREQTSVSVKNALTQVQMMFNRDPSQTRQFEILTINFFGFSTDITDSRQVFDVRRCFKNDDDYSWVTLTFDADAAKLANVKNDVPAIKANILNDITLTSELNVIRIPVIEVDFKENGLVVSLMILEKPYIMLDYEEPEKFKTIVGSNDVEGLESKEDCAKKCLESKDNCWGFSICGAMCYYGTANTRVADAIIGDKQVCMLYRRYDNNSFVPSKELMIENLRREVEDNMVHLMLQGKDDNMIQFDATSIQVTDPGEDDNIFEQIGNKIDPRMRVLKSGYRLSPSNEGAPIKNMGRLRYDECQRICLDFKACETMSYCLQDSECFISTAYGEDILKGDRIEENSMCNVLTRKYADHFGRAPGNVLSLTAEKEVEVPDVEGCARACLQEKDFKCLSFDHCSEAKQKSCKLHTVHFPSPTTREKVTTRATNCGHYYRKYSTEFDRKSDLRTVGGSAIDPLSNLTLEECAKACVEMRTSNCLGYDFCQDKTMLATSCTLLVTDPTKLKTAYSPICTSYQRVAAVDELHLIKDSNPYTTSYAGGIGFLCFLVGGLVGAGIVFGIAYFRVNRR